MATTTPFYNTMFNAKEVLHVAVSFFIFGKSKELKSS